MIARVARGVAALLLAAALGACGSDASPSGPAAPVDATGSWVLREGTLDGAPVPLVDGARITLIVSGSSVSGTAACNHYGGEVTLRDGSLTLDELSMTAMACDEPLMESEAAYLAALQAVAGARIEEDDLILFGERSELRFGRLEPVPTEAIVGTDWELESLVRGDVATSVAGERANLLLRADGSASGSTGCRSFVGRYVTVGDEIHMVELRMDGECPPALEGQDRHVVEVIGDGFTTAVDGDVLTLGSRGEIGLVYRATER